MRAHVRVCVYLYAYTRTHAQTRIIMCLIRAPYSLLMLFNFVTVRQINTLTIISLIISFTVTHTYHRTFQTSLVGSSPFRERLGSNRLPEKPRPRFEHVYVDDFIIVAFCRLLTM